MLPRRMGELPVQKASITNMPSHEIYSQKDGLSHSGNGGEGFGGTACVLCWFSWCCCGWVHVSSAKGAGEELYGHRHPCAETTGCTLLWPSYVCSGDYSNDSTEGLLHQWKEQLLCGQCSNSRNKSSNQLMKLLHNTSHITRCQDGERAGSQYWPISSSKPGTFH